MYGQGHGSSKPDVTDADETKSIDMNDENRSGQKLTLRNRKLKEKSNKITFASETKSKKKKSTIDLWLEESSSEEEDGDGPLEKVNYDHKVSTYDISTDHWIVQKLIRYIKCGNRAATIISICSLIDLNLNNEGICTSIRETGGLDVLVNLLECSDIACLIGSMKVLNQIAFSRITRLTVLELGAIELLLKLIHHTNYEVVWQAADLIGLLATTSSARRIVRTQNGIRRLVALLDIPSSYLGFVNLEGHQIETELSSYQLGTKKAQNFFENVFKERWEKKLCAAECAARALASFANSKRSRRVMCRIGIMPMIAHLMKSTSVELLSPIIGVVKEFAKEPAYRASIYSEKMIPDIVRTFEIDHLLLRRNAAQAIFKCADDETIRDQIRNCGGLQPLVSILRTKPKYDLILPVTGAIWRLSCSRENVEQFQKLNIIQLLIPLMHTQPEAVEIHVVGAFSEIMKVKEYRKVFLKSGGLEGLLQLQTRTKPQLLININNTIAQCAQDTECTQFIVKQDGVRLLWSVLKNPQSELQASATWAICPCIRNYGDSAELVRSFVGALDLLVGLLKSSDRHVLAGACAAIATVALDDENLAVMSDIGVVMLLSKLTCTNDEELQEHLADAIANCCAYADNRKAFGKEDAVVPLIKYLRQKNQKVHRTTAKALHQLSKFPDNCVTMHSAGCIPLLIQLSASADQVTQESAAKCMYNIRRLALANQIAADTRR